MTRMRWIAGLSLILAVGCTSENPEVSVLPAGSEAVVIGDNAHVLDRADDSVLLDPGTRVRVGYDSGVYHETAEDTKNLTSPQKYTPPDPISGFRQVRVVVENGPHQGKAGTVSRCDIRPIPH